MIRRRIKTHFHRDGEVVGIEFDSMLSSAVMYSNKYDGAKEGVEDLGLVRDFLPQ
jgi:hypothetical protein